MYKLTFTLIFIFSTFILIGQNKNIVLRIDSLILDDYKKISIRTVEKGASFFPDYIDTSTFIKDEKNVPNFICPLTLKNSESNIQIQIDDQGGFLLLIDAYSLTSDTLRIDKINVFSNCYQDTTFKIIDYFIRYNDSSARQFLKSKFSLKIEKTRCKNKPLINTTYKINGEQYFGLGEKKLISYETLYFHGHKPKKYLKDPDNYKGKVIKFSGRLIKKKYRYVVSIRLKNGT